MLYSQQDIQKREVYMLFRENERPRYNSQTKRKGTYIWNVHTLLL